MSNRSGTQGQTAGSPVQMRRASSSVHFDRGNLQRLRYDMVMSLADELFGPETAERPPPEAQRWEFFLAQGVQPVYTFVRRREGLGWTPARFVISYPDAKPPVAPDPAI